MHKTSKKTDYIINIHAGKYKIGVNDKGAYYTCTYDIIMLTRGIYNYINIDCNYGNNFCGNNCAIFSVTTLKWFPK